MSILLRVILGVTLPILLSTGHLGAGYTRNKVNGVDSYKIQIKRSQNFLLQNERSLAIQNLEEALKKEGPNSLGYKEIQRALRDARSLFLSEKAQQAYQRGQAFFFKDKRQALLHFKEASQLEPSHILVLENLIMVYLSLNDCRLSDYIYEIIKKTDPHNGNLKRWRWLIDVCNKDLDSLMAQESLDSMLIKDKQGDSFWIFNYIRVEIQKGKNDHQNLLDSLKTSDPELLYLRWMSTKDPLIRKKIADDYRNSCPTPTTFDKAYSWWDPWSCGHIDEMDSDR